MKYEDIKDFYERCDRHPDHQTGMISYRMIERRLQEEIEELRQYIEQREQSLQKPVAWMHTSIKDTVIAHRPADLKKHPDRWTALYPAPRPWQTLDDAEYQETLAKLGDGGLLAFYILIEAKLREKNT
jgi:hypothetical protein